MYSSTPSSLEVTENRALRIYFSERADREKTTFITSEIASQISEIGTIISNAGPLPPTVEETSIDQFDL